MLRQAVAEERGNCRMAAVLGPAGRSGMKQGVLDVRAGAAFDQQAHHIRMAIKRRVMKRHPMRVHAGGIEAIGILARVKQRAGHVQPSELSRQREGAVAVIRCCRRQQRPHGDCA